MSEVMQLPKKVVSPTDVARLEREVTDLDEFLNQQQIRTDGGSVQMPRFSGQLDVLLQENNLDISQPQQRQMLLSFLKNLEANAPVLHMSFSTDPPGSYVVKIVEWLRLNIDQNILLRVGLQPNIGAGCVVRTTNKSFDFSLRQYFKEKRNYFAAKLHESVTQQGLEQNQPPQQGATA
jgi:hypothetical protein